MFLIGTLERARGTNNLDFTEFATCDIGILVLILLRCVVPANSSTGSH